MRVVLSITMLDQNLPWFVHPGSSQSRDLACVSHCGKLNKRGMAVSRVSIPADSLWFFWPCREEAGGRKAVIRKYAPKAGLEQCGNNPVWSL